MTSRNLCACLALVAPGMCAWGQANVTLYGIVDAAATVLRSGAGTNLSGASPATAGKTVRQLDSGIGPGGRLGLRGSEELGGGWAAVFTLEGGIAADTGTFQQGQLAFGRQAFVGLRSRNWSLTAGRQYSPMDPIFVVTDALGGSYWGSTLTNSGHIMYAGLGATPGSGAFQTASRVDNSLLGSYQAGAVRTAFMVAAGNEDSRGAGRLVSASLSYGSQPLQVHVVYTRVRQNAQTIIAQASPEWLSEYLLGGSYEVGALKFFAGLYGMKGPRNRSQLSPAALASPFAYVWRSTDTAWIGVRVPVGTPGTLMAQVARTTYDYGSGPDGKGMLWGLAYEHALSKRTAVYLSLGRLDNNARANGYLAAAVAIALPNGYGASINAVSLGMRHVF